MAAWTGAMPMGFEEIMAQIRAAQLEHEEKMTYVDPNSFQRYSNEVATLKNEVDTFAVRYKLQIEEDERIVFKTSSDRNVANDAAFESLDVLVGELLNIQDCDEPVGKDALPHLPTVVDLFRRLSKTCEGAVDRMGQEFVDTTQYGGENRQLQDRLQDLLNRINGDLGGEKESLQRATAWRITCGGKVTTAENQLKDARDKKDGWYEVSTFFGGGGGIDEQIKTNERNLENCQNTYWEARKSEKYAEGMVRHLEAMKPTVEEQNARLVNLFWSMNAEYEKILNGRKVDERTWVATRTLEYHVCTNDVDTSRDDILRHVIQLIHTTVEQVDDDVDVQRFKKSIESRLLVALGSEKVDELTREKKHLPIEGVDF